MSRAAHVLTALALIAGLAAAGRLQQQNKCAVASTLPTLKHIDGARGGCGDAMWGTLVVGCVSASDLHNADWSIFGRKSDPFCRIRLSDKTTTEARGWSIVGNGYGKFEPRSETMSSRVIDNDLQPVWKEAFAFTMACPQNPIHDQYQLEVTVKDEDLTTTEFLGAVYVDLPGLIRSSEGKAPRSEEFTLETNAADENDKRKVKGSVSLVLQWCSHGDQGCVDRAVKEAGASTLKQTVKVDCGMGCHNEFGDVLGLVDSARGKVREAMRAEDAEDRYDDIEDNYEEQAEHAHGEERERLEQMHQMWKRAEEQAKQRKKRAWRDLQNQMTALQAGVGAKTQSSCGTELVGSVSEAASGLEAVDVSDKFKGKRAAKVGSQLDSVRSKLQGIHDYVRSEWWAGRMLPNTRMVTPECHAYFSPK